MRQHIANGCHHIPVAAISSSVMINLMPTTTASIRSTALALRDNESLNSDPRARTLPLRSTALGALQIELLECSPSLGAVRIHLPKQSHVGVFGLLLVAAESAASTAANLRCGDQHRAFGAELNASLLTREQFPISTAIVVATALNIDITQQVWRISAFNYHGAHLFEGRCTLSITQAKR